jgi:hypothetical protein
MNSISNISKFVKSEYFMTAANMLLKFMGEVVKESFIISGTGSSSFKHAEAAAAKKEAADKVIDKNLKAAKQVALRETDIAQVGVIFDTISEMVNGKRTHMGEEQWLELKGQFTIFGKLILASKLPVAGGAEPTDEYFFSSDAQSITESKKFQIKRVSKITKTTLGITFLVIG